MRAFVPQHLADLLQLYMVRVGGVWYGCRNKPEWMPQFGRYAVISAGVEAMFLWHDVLFVGSDRESLCTPCKGGEYDSGRSKENYRMPRLPDGERL